MYRMNLDRVRAFFGERYLEAVGAFANVSTGEDWILNEARTQARETLG